MGLPVFREPKPSSSSSAAASLSGTPDPTAESRSSIRRRRESRAASNSNRDDLARRAGELTRRRQQILGPSRATALPSELLSARISRIPWPYVPSSQNLPLTHLNWESEADSSERIPSLETFDIGGYLEERGYPFLAEELANRGEAGPLSHHNEDPNESATRAPTIPRASWTPAPGFDQRFPMPYARPRSRHGREHSSTSDHDGPTGRARLTSRTDSSDINGLGDRQRSWTPESNDWEVLLTNITPDPSLPSAASSFASNAAASPSSFSSSATVAGASAAPASTSSTIRPTRLGPARASRDSRLPPPPPAVVAPIEPLISPLPTPPPPFEDVPGVCDDELDGPQFSGMSATMTGSDGRPLPDSVYLQAVEAGLRTRQLARSVSDITRRYHRFRREYGGVLHRNNRVSAQVSRSVGSELAALNNMMDEIREMEPIPASWWRAAGIQSSRDGSLRRTAPSS